MMNSFNDERQISMTNEKNDSNKKNSSTNRFRSDILTEENFHRAHLGNRDIEELPSCFLCVFLLKRRSFRFVSEINSEDIERLKSMHIYTMQDLLGRFLIHDIPEEFHCFLLNSFQVSEETATIITQLLEKWTKFNLDVMIV